MNNITTDSNNLSEHIKTLEKYLSLMGIDSISVNLEIKNFNTDKDTVEINFENSEGFIAGSSPIALLNGIYRFLEKCGCRFLRPGKLGEIIPKNIKIPKINIKEEADFRHRGICIEGAVSKENVLDVIDWEAKNSMNTYFTQFRQSHTFFDRWYSHIYNPTETPNPITVEEADCILKD
ncbi:MAG: hypothetical protein KBT47_06715, partial [Armatimonadetes bacterium]|nr:hypothetical protein [Candidatus Hippobium faecium]